MGVGHRLHRRDGGVDGCDAGGAVSQAQYEQQGAAEEQWIHESIGMLQREYGGTWKEYPCSVGYFVSDQGKVARVVGAKHRMLIGCVCGQYGYRAITWIDSHKKKRRFYIHRAVCELFNGPPPDGMQCRHLNGNRNDNRAVNLAWGTPKENSADMKLHGTVLIGERNPMAQLTRDQVAQMRCLRDERGAAYRHIARQFGVSTMTAFRAVTGRAWK